MDPWRLVLLEGNLDDEEFLVVWNMLKRKEERFFEETFDLDSMDDSAILQNFRFSSCDIKKLKMLFNIPDVWKINQLFQCDGLESMCLVLRRLSYPNRLCDLFGHSESQLSLIFNHVLDHIYTNFLYLLQDVEQEWIVNSIPIFANAISAKGAPLQNCWGFLDGTVRPMCRPQQDQQLVYNGHKRVHSLKYQSLMCPNGLIANLSGPFEGRRHDAFILQESGLVEKIAILGDEYCIYGDPAYPLRHPIINPYPGHHLTEEQEEFNKNMSSVRQCVEWGFGKLLQNFSFVDFKKNQKLYLQPLAKYYFVSAILTNCHTCLYGSVTTSFFNVKPPTLEEYLQARI